jgi:glucose/arabinose dehydrogenase
MQPGHGMVELGPGHSLRGYYVQVAVPLRSWTVHTEQSSALPQVYVAVDTDSDGRADAARTFATGLDHPNGVVWHNGSLFVMTNTRLLRFDDADSYALSGRVSPACAGKLLLPAQQAIL